MPARKRWTGWITTESAALTQPLPWQRAAKRMRRAERAGAERAGAALAC